MTDEWTFVSHRKHHRRTGNDYRKSSNTASKIGSVGGSGLYRATIGSGSRRQVCNSNSDECTDLTQASSDQRRNEKERIIEAFLECFHALEDQYHSRNGFAFHLIASLSGTASDDPGKGGNATTKNHEGISEHKQGSLIHLREIVAYGIGNFSVERFHPPMLQLACLLLIRRCAAGTYNHTERDEHNTLRSFERDQRDAPIFFYEPCILPVEKALLETVFHVYVLESNNMGKLTLESMRRQHQQKLSDRVMLSNSPVAGTPMCSGVTLFYMPHCPMQLYCNVLWAHWYHIFPLDSDTLRGSRDNPIIIFGNSFCTYDERTISKEKRLEQTNGIFRVIPFVKETPLRGSGSSSSARRCGPGEVEVDALRHLEMAFNDCNILCFPVRSTSNIEIKTLPERPVEWIASGDHEDDGELK